MVHDAKLIYAEDVGCVYICALTRKNRVFTGTRNRFCGYSNNNNITTVRMCFLIEMYTIITKHLNT
jgi:hypothetical protein